MLPTHIGGGSGQGGGVNANNFTTNDPESGGGGLSHSFIDDNDENKYRTKEKSFPPRRDAHAATFFISLHAKESESGVRGGAIFRRRFVLSMAGRESRLRGRERGRGSPG